MGKRKKRNLPKATIALFSAAAVLLAASSIGGARAALTYFSENYVSRIEMNHIGVTLNEKAEKDGKATAVSQRDYDQDGKWKEKQGELLGRDLENDGSIRLGKAYPEYLNVTNSGDIDEYVRVTISKYWLDQNGNKMQSLSPELINLNLLCDRTEVNNGWLLDTQMSNSEYAGNKPAGERTVLYYNKPLAPGETTPDLSDKIAVLADVAFTVSQTTETEADGYKTITTTYDYDGVSFRVEAVVDAVQTHNAEDAILSAWGRKVNISGETLSFR